MVRRPVVPPKAALAVKRVLRSCSTALRTKVRKVVTPKHLAEFPGASWYWVALTVMLCSAPYQRIIALLHGDDHKYNRNQAKRYIEMPLRHGKDQQGQAESTRGSAGAKLESRAKSSLQNQCCGVVREITTGFTVALAEPRQRSRPPRPCAGMRRAVSRKTLLVVMSQNGPQDPPFSCL